MLRTVTMLAALFVVLAQGGELLAQDAWPAYTVPFARGPGGYLAWWKLLLLGLVAFAWVKSADWVSRDSLELGSATGMTAQVWNPVMVFSFLVAFLLAITIPVFAAGLGVAALAYILPFVIYVVMRNGKVTGDQKVFTPDHIKHWLAGLGKKKPKQREVKHAWQLGPAVEIVAVGPLQMENQQALIEARQSAVAYVSVKRLLADAIANRAEKVFLDFTANDVAVRYQIDGVQHAVTPKVHDKHALDRKLGDTMLAILKRVCHLKPEERRARQDGKMRIEFEGSKWDTSFVSQGTQTGERAQLSFTLITKQVRKLEELGMRDKLREQLAELIGPEHHGLVIFSALPGDGLTATWQSALRETDRLMRDFVSVEEVHKREPDVENVDVQKYDATKGETVEGLMPNLIRKQPEVICIPEIASGDALKQLCDWIKAEDRLGLVSLRAKDASEAILRLLALKAPAESVAGVLKGVVYIRLIRRLCEACREAVQPTPELLQRLGIPAGRVQVLYREKQPPQPGQEKKRGQPEICPACKGLGYKGRIAIYEILTLDDRMRQALTKQPKLDDLRKLAKAAGNRNLQEEGILLVALWTTSIAELQRVLKQ
jgi:type II secretory ATPase GspE/PulE/Tfp pilus assembly ATPase PilB-like protein